MLSLYSLNTKIREINSALFLPQRGNENDSFPKIEIEPTTIAFTDARGADAPRQPKSFIYYFGLECEINCSMFLLQNFYIHTKEN